MGATLEALLELQDIELQIVDIRRQLTRKERAAKAQGAKLETAIETVRKQRENLRRAQVEVDELDLDLKARSANANRLREHLNTVRTNKEYAAVLAQLNNEKADVSRLESRALEQMGRIEAQREQVAAHEEAERLERQRLENLTTELAHAQQSFADRLAVLQGQRNAAAEKLGAETINLFERLSERYDGEALAQVERTHPRRDEFTCGGCYMSLNAEIVNALMTRNDVQTCKNCGRIVYVRKR